VSETVLAAAPAQAPPVPAGILGLGTALPETVVPTSEIAARLGVEPEWIVSRTGIEERRHAAPELRLGELAARAGEAALGDAGVGAEDVDLVVVATVSADDLMPSAASAVAGHLGCRRAGSVDVAAACTGFLSALSLAAGQVESGRAGTVLVVGAEILSRLTDHGDRRTAALFGDGAGAVVVGPATGEAGIGPIVLGTEPQRDLLFMSRERGLIEMEGHEVFRHAVARMVEATRTVCDPAEIDLFVYHQANARILRAVAARLDIDPARVVNAIDRHGNTSAASIPLALDEVRDRLRPGSRILACAFGAGFTWGAGVITW
jgi:3-oxoacyl-[acyl-carrier-protein] synthase III